MNSCKKCKEPVGSDYCPNCGQPAILRRIDKHYIAQETKNFFGASKRMVYTIKKVFVNPGKSVRQFLAEERYKFVKPITFVIVTSVVFTLINYFFQAAGNGFVNPTIHIEVDGHYGIELILRWLAENYAFSNLLMLPFIAFWIKIFFKKYDYNIFEIFTLLCFIFGISMLLFSIGVIFQSFTPLRLGQISAIAGIYPIWAIGQFFDKKKAASYAKALLSYILGAVVFTAIILLVGYLADIVIKH